MTSVYTILEFSSTWNAKSPYEMSTHEQVDNNQTTRQISDKTYTFIGQSNNISNN